MKAVLQCSFLCFLLLGATAARAQAMISFAEKPVQVIRGTVLHVGGSGVLLESGDLLGTDDGSVQIVGISDTTLALGPKTRLAFERNGTAVELALLDGWVKLQIKAVGSAITIQTARLRVRVTKGTLIVHAGALRDEVFVEDGTQLVAELDARRQVQRDIKLEREQFAFRTNDEALKSGVRPNREFIDQMPRAFRDMLVPVALKTKAGVALKKEREVNYDDVAPWLVSRVVLLQSPVSRFLPRLKDPAFRQPLEAALGQSREWKPILYPSSLLLPKKPG